MSKGNRSTNTSSNSNFLSLNKNLLQYTFRFNNKNDYYSLLRIKNKRLFSIIYDIRLHFLNNFFMSNPTSLKVQSILATDCRGGPFPNRFVVFSFNRLQILAYSSLQNKIVLLNIETKNHYHTFEGHKNTILCLRENVIQNTQYLITSSFDSSCKVWNINKLSCELTLNHPHLSSFIYSCLLLSLNNSNFIVTSVCSKEPIRVFDFKGYFVSQYGDGTDYNYFIDFWQGIYNEPLIIDTTNNDVRIYNLEDNTCKIYKEDDTSSQHWNAVVFETEKTVFLLDADNEGIIRIWDLYKENLVSSLKIGGSLKTILIWNKFYIIVVDNNSIKVINIIEGTVVNNLFIGDKIEYCMGMISKCFIKKYGEIMIGGYDNQLILWSTNILL